MPPTAARLNAKQLLGTAEKLLAERDISGSRRFALRALDADPLLDGVDQVLAVADVLLAAEKRVNNHLDWYAILRIESDSSAVDLATIKRKYRKLALLLHPDKNKSAGAESAFKLVLDAWSLLSDPAKRALYDKEREIALHLGGGAAEAGAGQRSFWTGCPYCYHMHEFLRFYENRNLRCPKCRQAFRATEVKSMPQMAEGTDAYYFNWGYSYPMMPMGGCGYGGPGPSPYLGMPNMVNPFYPPASQQGTAPADHGRGSVESPVENSGVDKEGSGGKSKPADVRRELRSRRGTNVSPAKAPEKIPRGKPAVPAPPVRHSPRLEKLKKENVGGGSVYGEEDVEESKEVAVPAKKGARKAMPQKSAEKKSLEKEKRGSKAVNGGENCSASPEKKPKRGSNADNGGGNGSVAAIGSFQNERVEPSPLHVDMQDPDISDILNSLPKIYDMKGEEVEINF